MDDKEVGTAHVDLVVHLPNLQSSIDKKTKLAHKIAYCLCPPKSDSVEDRQASYVNYTQQRSKLRARCAAFEKKQREAKQAETDKEMQFKRSRGAGSDAGKLWCELKKAAPISDRVLNPTAMPVEVAPLAELQPFFDFLRAGTHVARVEHIAFTRGAVYSDGRIDLCKQVVGPNWIQQLMQSIAQNPNVKHFLLGNNIIDRQGAQAIADFISSKTRAPRIETWYLAGNCIDAEGVELIANALATDRNATHLWLKRNPIKPQGAKALARHVGARSVDVDNSGLDQHGLVGRRHPVPV